MTNHHTESRGPRAEGKMQKRRLILPFRSPGFSVPVAGWGDQRLLPLAAQVDLRSPRRGESNGILQSWNGASPLALSWAGAKLKSQPQPKSAPSPLPAGARPPRAPETGGPPCRVVSLAWNPFGHPRFSHRSSSGERSHSPPLSACWMGFSSTIHPAGEQKSS